MSADEAAAAAEPPARRRRPRRGEPSSAPLWLTGVAPVAIALLSLALSVYSLVEANREPEVRLSAPDVVRLASGETPWLYVQPHLVSAANNDRVAVISGLSLEVQPPGASAPVAFAWTEQGTWQYRPEDRGLDWFYVADPAPLVVGPSSPQLPICLFEGPPGWRWQAGAYALTIVAARAGAAEPLRTPFAITLSEEHAAFINENQRRWIEARTTQAGAGRQAEGADPIAAP